GSRAPRYNGVRKGSGRAWPRPHPRGGVTVRGRRRSPRVMSSPGGFNDVAAWLAPGAGPVFGFGIPGLRGVVLVALVALALYGRAGSRLLLSTRTGRAVGPWGRLLRMAVTPASAADPRRRPAPPGGPSKPPRRRPQGRLFWALALIAAAAVAAG